MQHVQTLKRKMTKTFTHFVGIDWSGAKGSRHPGIAVAVCGEGNAAPNLIGPPSGRVVWSRQECVDWIAGGCGLPNGAQGLVGMDSAFSMPFMDKGFYLNDELSAQHALELWQEVESICQHDTDLYGGAFVEAYQDHYLQTGTRGAHYQRRMRVTETCAVDSGAGPCESVFHLIGPSQVGLAGLSTVRMLAQISVNSSIAVWPYDEGATASIVLAEIYAAAFAALGGHRGKVRDRTSLNKILSSLDSKPFRKRNVTLTDHVCDALVTSAALRLISGDRKYWHPDALSTKVRETEGWVLGIL